MVLVLVVVRGGVEGDDSTAGGAEQSTKDGSARAGRLGENHGGSWRNLGEGQRRGGNKSLGEGWRNNSPMREKSWD